MPNLPPEDLMDASNRIRALTDELCSIANATETDKTPEMDAIRKRMAEALCDLYDISHMLWLIGGNRTLDQTRRAKP